VALFLALGGGWESSHAAAGHGAAHDTEHAAATPTSGHLK
jgi:hypothetical protein